MDAEKVEGLLTTPTFQDFAASFNPQLSTKYHDLKRKIEYDQISERSYENELNVIVTRWRSILTWREFTKDEIDKLIPSIGERFFVRRDPKDPSSPGLFDTEKMKKFTDIILVWLMKPTIIKQYMQK